MPCPEVMRAEVSAADRQQWSVDVPLLAASLGAALGITDPVKSLASDRVWHFGQINWHGQMRDVVLARGLARKGTEDLVPVFADLLKPIVFVPDERPAPDYWGRAAPPVVALSAIASLGANGIEINRRVLTAMVAQAEDQSTAAYVFLLKGEYWQITFEGETQYFKDSVGLAHIARLLAARNRCIPANLLLAAQSGLDVLAFSGSSGENVTAQGRESYAEQWRDLNEELAKARKNNDDGLIQKLEGDIEAVGDELLKATGFNDRPRTKSDLERARVNVTTAINRSIEKIHDKFPALGQHLMTFVSTGITCRYSPDREIDWLV